MNKSKRVSGMWLLVVSLVALLISGCSLTPGSTGKGTKTEQSSKEPTPIRPGFLDPSLFPTLTVSGNSCFVFLKPTNRSDNFGPLKKGENIKKIAAQGEWIRVWIPRLRTSGWVSKSEVFEIEEKTSSPEGIPIEVLDTVTVISSRANIRKTPTTRSSKIYLAKRKEIFVVLTEREGWYQIWVSPIKEVGWIYGKIVTRSSRGESFQE